MLTFSKTGTHDSDDLVPILSPACGALNFSRIGSARQKIIFISTVVV